MSPLPVSERQLAPTGSAARKSRPDYRGTTLSPIPAPQPEGLGWRTSHGSESPVGGRFGRNSTARDAPGRARSNCPGRLYTAGFLR